MLKKIVYMEKGAQGQFINVCENALSKNIKFLKRSDIKIYVDLCKQDSKIRFLQNNLAKITVQRHLITPDATDYILKQNDTKT